jgi:two-component system CheB/CheR fusion protein
MTILVVEDDEDSREMLLELVRALGLQSLGVASGSELFDSVPHESWGMALIDLSLPDLDGYEIARRLRALPTTCNRRLIALTGYSDAAARNAASNAGFDAFLVKPILPEQLVRTLGLVATK